MATIDTSRTYGSYGLVGRISASISAIVASVVDWNDARVSRNALSGLSDRELEDIGMVRGDIDRVAERNRIF
ncbi:MAG: DUF1127 domain-containing protein [Paracoccaceae bacterium]